MKAKPIFYLNGNNRRFEDQHTISVMTGEPMPRKWQEFFELTPEEKARWDASLKLDEEYRIAEAQGFPNGIPGGKTRGDMLHYLTQQEEAHKKSMQERSFLGQSFIPNKTEIQRYNNIIPNDTLVYGQGNEQPSFTFNQKLNTESLYARPNNLLQMNTDIKKEPAFDVKQAIRKIASRLEARTADSEGQDKMNLPTKLELYELLSPYGTTYKEIKEAYPQTTHDEEQVDQASMTFEDMININKQAEAEMKQMIENKPVGEYITDYERYEVLSKYGLTYSDIRKIRLAAEEKLNKQKCNNQSITASTGENKSKQWEKNLEKDDYSIFGDKNGNRIVVPIKEFVARQAMNGYDVELAKKNIPSWRWGYNGDLSSNAIAQQDIGSKKLGDIVVGEGDGVVATNAFIADVTTNVDRFNEIKNAVLNDNSVPEYLRTEFPKSCDYIASLLGEYGVNLVMKLPAPIHVKATIATIVFAATIVSIAVTVKERRDNEIDRLKKTKPYAETLSEGQIIEMANSKVEGWFLEEIGKEIVKKVMGKIMNEKKISEDVQPFVIAAWDTFVQDREREYQKKLNKQQWI